MKKTLPDILLLLLLCTVAGVTVFIRLRYIHLPLDRDEGEYAYSGWRMLNGGVPFRDYYNMKMPGIYAVFAFFFLFLGATIEAVRISLLVVNLASALMIFQCGKQIGGRRMGIYSAICFLIFSIQLDFQGLNAYAEHYAVFFLLLGLFFYLKSAEKSPIRNLFLSGLSIGASFLMKQPAMMYTLCIAVLIIISEIRDKRQFKPAIKKLFIFLSAAAIPLLLTVAILSTLGAFHNFKLFTFEYARYYGSGVPLKNGFNNCLEVLHSAISPARFFWLLSLLGILSALLSLRPKNSPTILFLLLLIFSFIAVSFGWFFRPHYFIFLLPALAFLSAYTLSKAEELLHKYARIIQYSSVLFLLFSSIYFFNSQRALYFSTNDENFIRKNYHFDIFNVAAKTTDSLVQHSKPNSTIAIFGAEPEIWFYTKRKAASGFLYTYPLMENHPYAAGMLQTYLNETMKSKPDILVFTAVEGTWFGNEEVHKKIVDWYKSYRDSSFKRLCMVDLINDSTTNYYWNPDSTVRPTNEERYIEIDERIR